MTAAFEAVDRAFSGAPRPEKFTDHPYCEECAEWHEYSSAFTPETLADVIEPPETLGISFLTDDAFVYLLPGMLRWIVRTGPLYCVGDVLFHVENRLHALSPEQRHALRDFLYLVYDRLGERIHGTAFDYPMPWRILNDLDGATVAARTLGCAAAKCSGAASALHNGPGSGYPRWSAKTLEGRLTVTEDQRAVLERVYAAFNQRRIDEVLSAMHPDVEWPNGMDGGYVHGHAEVREYWTRQWGMIDPSVTPTDFAEEPDGRIAVKVRQVIRNVSGEVIADREVEHVYRFRDGLVDHMEIRTR